MIRLFVALQLAPEARKRLLSVCRGLPGVRWQRDDQLHLTLRFIGEVEEPAIDDIKSVLGAVRATPFSYDITAMGLFGTLAKPRILWAGVAPKAPFLALHERIEQALVGCGLAPDGRRFSPHITLARFGRGGEVRARRLGAFIAAHDPLFIPGQAAEGFALYASFLSPSGAHYRIEESYPLQDRARR